MPFDPFRKREIRLRPHVADALNQYCTQCGAHVWDWYSVSCDPESEEAKKYRREHQDRMVGRVTGNSTGKC